MKTLIIFTTLLFNQFLAASVIESSVKFVAKGKPSFIKIKGEAGLKSGTLTLKENKLKGEFVLDLSTIKTGVELRDNHLKEKYLEVNKEKFKHAKLTFSAPYDGKKEKHIIAAMLNLHGEEKEVELDAEIINTNNVMSIKVKFPISIHHYNIDVPSFKGITVAKKVDIAVVAKVSVNDAK